MKITPKGAIAAVLVVGTLTVGPMASREDAEQPPAPEAVATQEATPEATEAPQEAAQEAAPTETPEAVPEATQEATPAMPEALTPLEAVPMDHDASGTALMMIDSELFNWEGTLRGAVVSTVLDVNGDIYSVEFMAATAFTADGQEQDVLWLNVADDGLYPLTPETAAISYAEADPALYQLAEHPAAKLAVESMS